MRTNAMRKEHRVLAMTAKKKKKKKKWKMEVGVFRDDCNALLCNERDRDR